MGKVKGVFSASKVLVSDLLPTGRNETPQNIICIFFFFCKHYLTIAASMGLPLCTYFLLKKADVYLLKYILGNRVFFLYDKEYLVKIISTCIKYCFN